MIRKENRLEHAIDKSWLAEERAHAAIDQAPDFDAQVSEDIRLRFHELSIHQIELEMQNEELRRTQIALDEARARYFDLYDQAPVGYCTLSPQGLILEANLTAVTMLGLSRGALLNQLLVRFIFNEDQDIYYLSCKQNIEICGPEVCEVRMVKADGSTFWAQLAASTAQLAGGGSECRIVISDITKRKRTEEALRQSEQHANDAKKMLKLVVDTIPVRLFWKDLSSVYMGCNQLFAEDAGYQIPEELIGLDDYNLGWRAQADSYRQDDLEVMNSGNPKLDYEEMQTTAEGKQICLSTSKVPLRDADDRIIGVLGAYQDITLRKQLEEEHLTAQKLEALGLLAGGIAHNFNNILMVIMGNITFAKMLLPPTSKVYERLTVAETAAVQAKDLTRQFHTFSKGGAPVKNSIAPAHLLKNYSRFVLAGTKSTCEYAIPEGLWNIDADEGQIGQALINVLVNADQSMQDGGVIKIDCENVVVCDDQRLPLKNGEYVKIAIKDQGTGIPEKYLGKIFDPYFTTREKGRGLGLAAVYSILQKHGGHIAVESTPGAGTTFTLFIPAAVSLGAATSTVKEQELDIVKGSEKILVMDDDKEILQLIGTTLEELGYEVVFAQDGEEALTMYVDAHQTGRPFDVVIMDLIVPVGMGGKEAMRKLLALDPRAKVIVSSGYCNDQVMTDYKSYGFSGAIAKPYHPAELSKQIQQVLHN